MDNFGVEISMQQRREMLNVCKRCPHLEFTHTDKYVGSFRCALSNWMRRTIMKIHTDTKQPLEEQRRFDFPANECPYELEHMLINPELVEFYKNAKYIS